MKDLSTACHDDVDLAQEANMADFRAWRTLKRTLVLDHSPWMRVLIDDIELPDGRVIEGYLHLDAPGFAMIVPIDRQARMGFVRSYKRGVGGIDTQPPAGMVDDGEDPAETAKRELLEELGCEASEWHALGAYTIGGNFGGGQAHIFIAEGCDQVAEPYPQDLEDQEIIWLPQDQAYARWNRGEFKQLATAAALGLAFAHLKAIGGHVNGE
jgi:ADP-ribose pyrophosphatase